MNSFKKCVKLFSSGYYFPLYISPLKTCFKNPSVPTSIDLMTTNQPRSFKHSMVVKTGLLDFHKM